jgi:hypothetical protein
VDVEDVDSGFWWKLIGGVLLLGIVLFIALGVLLHVMNRWGLFGVIVAIGVVALGAGWIFDRRTQRRRAEAERLADLAEAQEKQAREQQAS